MAGLVTGSKEVAGSRSLTVCWIVGIGEVGGGMYEGGTLNFDRVSCWLGSFYCSGSPMTRVKAVEERKPEIEKV